MSREEAVNAYIAGRIPRRTFIRHLMTLGVSVGAALTYAEILAPQRASSQGSEGGSQDHYPDDDRNNVGNVNNSFNVGGSGAARPADPGGAGGTGTARPATPVVGLPPFTG